MRTKTGPHPTRDFVLAATPLYLGTETANPLITPLNPTPHDQPQLYPLVRVLANLHRTSQGTHDAVVTTIDFRKYMAITVVSIIMRHFYIIVQ